MSMLIGAGIALLFLMVIGSGASRAMSRRNALLEVEALDPVTTHMESLASRRGLTRHGASTWAGAGLSASMSMSNQQGALALTVELDEGCLLAQISLQEKPRSSRSAQEQSSDIALGITSFDARFLVQGRPASILAGLDDEARKTWLRLTAPPSAPESLRIEAGHLHARWERALAHSVTELDAWLSRLEELLQQTRHAEHELPELLLRAAQQEHQDSDRHHSYAQRCGQTLLQQYPQSAQAQTWLELVAAREQAQRLEAQRAQDASLLKKHQLTSAELLRAALVSWCKLLGVEPPITQDSASVTLTLDLYGCALFLEASLSPKDRSAKVSLTLHAPGIDQALTLTANADAKARERLLDAWSALDAAHTQRIRLFQDAAWSASDQRRALVGLSELARASLSKLVLHPRLELMEGELSQGVFTLRMKLMDPLDASSNTLWIRMVKELCEALSTPQPEPSDEAFLALITEHRSIVAMHQLYVDDAPKLWATLTAEGIRDIPAIQALRSLSPDPQLRPTDHLQLRRALLEDAREDGPIRAAALETLLHDANTSHEVKAIEALIQAALNLTAQDIRQEIVRRAAPLEVNTPETSIMWMLLRAPARLPSVDEPDWEQRWVPAIARVLTEDQNHDARHALLKQLPALMPSRQLAKHLTTLAISDDDARLTMKAEDLMLTHDPTDEDVPKMLLARRSASSLEADWMRAIDVMLTYHSPSEDAATLFLSAACHAPLDAALKGAIASRSEQLSEPQLWALFKVFKARQESSLLTAVLETYTRRYSAHPSTFEALCAACERLPEAPQRFNWAAQAIKHPVTDKTMLWEVLAQWAIEHPSEAAGAYGLQMLQEHAEGSPQLRRALLELATTHPDPDQRIWCLIKLGPFALEPGLKLLEQRGFDDAHKLKVLELLWGRGDWHAMLIKRSAQILRASELETLGYVIARYTEGEQALLDCLLKRFEEATALPHLDAILDAFLLTKPAQAQHLVIEKLKQTHAIERKLKWIEALATLGVARVCVPALMDYEATLARLGDGLLKDAIARAIATLQAKVDQGAQQSLEVLDGGVAGVGSLSVKKELPEGSSRGDLKLSK